MNRIGPPRLNSSYINSRHKVYNWPIFSDCVNDCKWKKCQNVDIFEISVSLVMTGE